MWLFLRPNESSASGHVGPCVSLGSQPFYHQPTQLLSVTLEWGVTGDLSDVQAAVDLATPLPTVILRGIADLRVDRSPNALG